MSSHERIYITFTFYLLLLTSPLYIPTEIRIHKVIEKSIGCSVSTENSANIAPMIAPIAKRNIPISELAVPAVRGNSSRTAALALLDTIETIPTYRATPMAEGHSPQ